MNDSSRTHAQSHAVPVPPSNGATGRSSASRKAQTVYLVSYNTTFREQTYIRWCCIDLLRPPRRSGVSAVRGGLTHLPRTPFLDSFRVGNHSFRIATSVVQFWIADARCEIESICSLPLVTQVRMYRAMVTQLYSGPRMALTPGAKLGPYEIQSPLGAGGMAEIYCASDTSLDREFAIKVLPTSLSSDGSLKQRL